MGDGDPLIIGKPNTGNSKTSLTADVFDPTLFVENTGGGTNSALAVKYVGPAAGGSAITAEANFTGLTAVCTHETADSIVGEALATSGTATGVMGFTEAASIYSQEPRHLCGVHGFANTGTGVRGDSISGFGVSAASSSGIALKVEGTAAFATAGNGSIGRGLSKITVPEVHVTAFSHITVTLTGQPGPPGWRRCRRGNQAAVHWIERIAGVGFVVHFSRKLANDTPFSYLVVEPIG
jgi:hypothetical protein